MARNPKKSTWEFKGFVNFKLDKKAKSDYLKWLEKADESWFQKSLYEALTSGYAIKLAYSEDQQAFTCHMTAIAPTDTPDQVGYILSSFGPEPMALIQLTLYKHYILLGKIWLMGNREDEGNWG